jgi:outer membrane receptor protein involved in Fe transport
MKGSTGYADARPRFNALSSAIAATLAVSSAGVVQAQEQQQQQRSVDEITVTGSRIVRQDFTSNSPVQTVDEQAFQQTAIVGVETVLNKLPQFVPAVTQFTTGDVQQTATNTVGASTISLRGLGANRNLVLINGRRGMPVNPTMVVDTNSIPSSAIQRVEVISGGASAVYGADAVGGVVNFILKDDYEGASIDVRLGDTQHGGDQTTHISGLFGVNSADDRGNIMLGIERDTRAKQFSWQRDWWVADRANPNTTGGFFAFGSATWFHNEPAANLAPGAPGSFGFANNPDQNVVNSIFPAGACPNPSPTTGCTISNNLNSTRFRINRDGSVFTGLQDSQSLSPGAYLFNGPVWNDGQSGDLDGAFQGLPVFVRMANGAIKENVMYNWASSPLERLSGFANGHFDISDNIRLTGQAMVTRTKTESSLGLSSANINQWGAGIPFGNGLYRGNSDPYFDIPDSLCTVAGRDGCTAAGVTNPAYTLNGRFGVNCDAPVGTPGMPWADGQPGCTKSEAFPVPPDIYRLMISRGAPTATPGVGAGGEEIVWASREPDWMRNALGAARSTTNTTTTMSFSMGIEGDLPSGNHSWDVTLATGRSDNTVNQLGSMRLHSYRDVLAYPNWGKGAFFDPNPWESAGFAETNPTCTSGLPIADNRQVSEDCVQILAPALKNLQEMTQTTLEANLTGDLAQMKAGPLQYALGTSYRENSFDYTPDNLSDQQNEIDTVAGLFPTEHSAGEFDVTELYGELLVPLISDGPTGVEHFNLELGARISDWSMPQMPDLKTYKALVDWGITPRYRIRGGFNRAFRAPNLGELFVARTQIFGGGGATRDWCSTGLDLGNRGSFSATPADFVAATATNPGNPGTPTAQTAQSRAICEALMGAQGTAFYYDPGRTQDAVGGAGIPNSFGNPNLREEQADTWTLGVTMDLLEDWRLSVDWWKIDIEDMIALEGGDATYQACLDIAFNPTGNPNAPACQRIFRNPTTGGGGIINRSFTNQGLASFEGVDIQLNWSHQLSGGGSLNLNSSLTTTLHEITQDTPSVAPVDQKGYNNCSLQLQCLNYDYRVFTTLGYGRGMWNVSLTHQYWPDLPNNSCRTNVNAVSCVYNSLPAYQLFSANANIRFNDKYTFSVGLENLLDKDPPCLNSNPTLTPTTALPFQFPTDCTHSGDGSTYDPLGRTYFISMTMDF